MLKVGNRRWDDHWQENWFWEAGGGRDIKSTERNQVVARMKTTFKMKIRGKRKMIWSKRREGQNTRFKLKYNIKSSDLICTILKDKKWMLKTYAGEKISQIMEQTTVDFVLVASSIYHCFLFLDLPLVARWCPSLALGSLFKTTRDPQSMADSFRC